MKTDEEIFDQKARYNTWLYELTIEEVRLILELMEEARQDEAQYS